MGVAQPVLENARDMLERKAKLYDKLRKGKSAGLDDNQYSTLLVDVRISLRRILVTDSIATVRYQGRRARLFERQRR